MACPYPETIAKLATGKLLGGERGDVQAHVDQCDSCALAMRRVLAASLEETMASAQGEPPRDGRGAVDASLDDTVATADGGAVARANATTRQPGDATAQDPVRALAVGDKVGRYMVLSLLGAGGMGEVYAAYDPELDRRVALKMLRPALADSTADGNARAHLEREARAMARLAHPNVIAVHDVGTLGRDLYVAMEYVEGAALDAWLEQAERSHSEVIEVFTAAARGLAAAHDAGLVHRDFKPENVLVGPGQRVRVIDFGVARPLSPPPRPARDGDLEPPYDGADRDADDDATTQVGALVGTPAYMAPEQFNAVAADARTDQFNFGIALYEAVYGERPFAGDNLASLAVAVTSGERRPVPQGRDVPEWLRRAIERMIAQDPNDRFPSMEAVVVALQPPARRRRTVPAVAAGAVALTAVAGAWFFGSPAAEPCSDQDAPLAGVWDEARKREIRAALVGTNLPYAEDAWTRVETSLDRYTARWVDERTDACLDTAVRREQSEAVLDRRMACLDSRLHELDALTALLSSADADIAQNAVQAATGLVPPRDCASGARIASASAGSGEASDDELAELDRELANVKALHAVGRYKDAREAAIALVERTVDVPSRQARASYWLGRATATLGEAEAGAEALFAAVRAATLAGDRRMEADAWIWLAMVAYAHLENPREAERWADQAEAVLAQAGADVGLAAQLRYARGGILRRRHEYEEALSHYREAAALYSRAFGEDYWKVATAHSMEASTLGKLDRHDEALALYERALEAFEAALGSQHPLMASALTNYGVRLRGAGRFEEARRAYERAIEHRTATLGPDHPALASPITNIGYLEERFGNYEKALAQFDRALEIRERELGKAHPATARSLKNVARIARKQGRHDDAEALAREAVSRYEIAVGPDAPATAEARILHCRALTQLDRTAEARQQCARALEVLEKGADRGQIAWALTHAGLAELSAGKAAAALEALERAYRLREEEEDSEESDVAETAFALARALVAGGGDRDRALELAHSARAALADVPPGNAELLPELEAWLGRQEPVANRTR